MAEKGRFYVFEGIDGSGKSTCAKSVYDFLVKNYYECVLTEEPNEKFGIRKIIKEHLICNNTKINVGIADLLGYALDRRIHDVMLIIPSIEMGKMVICDRRYHSCVYQAASGVSLAYALSVNSFAVKPDRTFICDIDAKTAMQRISGRKFNDKFENISFLDKVAEKYRELPSHLTDEKIDIIDARKSEEEVKQQVIKIIKEDLRL